MNLDDDLLSGYLDRELDPASRREVAAALAADPELRTELLALGRVRSWLRTDGLVDFRLGGLDRIVAAVRTDELESDSAVDPGTVVPLAKRRRIQVFAAVAASFVIIVGVVGGLGGRTMHPAVANLVAQHEAAAATAHEPMDDDMPAMADMPALADDMEMMQLTVVDNVVHVLYEGSQGASISVFRLVGELDMDGLADDMDTGEISELDGHAMWSADMGHTRVVVLDGDGYVWTIVGDSGSDLAMDLMVDLPTRPPTFSERVRDLADAVVEPFRLGAG